MCGNVSYFGLSGGVARVLDALQLLAYRAPDSSGLAVIDHQGRFAVRRAVGDSRSLRAKIEAEPLPPLRQGSVEVVMGHGRWAMVGAVTEENAHPLADRSGRRLCCENGSHNANLMLAAFQEQERWWRARGVPADERVHHSDNTTTVLTYEWERMAHLLSEGEAPRGSEAFLAELNRWGIDDLEERALRLAVWRLKEGNAHACTFYGQDRPETLYVTSHNKPIAIAMRTVQAAEGYFTREVMVASDVNAALMLWPADEVAAVAGQIEALQAAARRGQRDVAGVRAEIANLVEPFTVEVIFLDADLFQGQELFAQVYNAGGDGRPWPEIQVSRYDGSPVEVAPRPLALHPAMAGKGGYPSYTESHIAEIPEILERLAQVYAEEGQIRLESIWREEMLFQPGLNGDRLRRRFGPALAGLKRLLLIGEGSSWRDAQAAAPLFRQLLPGALVNVYRPVEVLNLGRAVDPSGDLAVEISWSGTTDSLLKVDRWLGERGLLRLAVTGRPQSDLGRRTVADGGTLDVHTGVEISVATVKGFEAILMTLDLLALHLAGIQGGAGRALLTGLANELTLVVPAQVRLTLEDESRRQRLRQVARRCRHFNKIAVIGDSPVDVEAELKIEELAQVVAWASDFHAASLRPLMERSALVEHDRHRTLFVINASSPEAQGEAQAVIHYLQALGLFCLIHTTVPELVGRWQRDGQSEVFISAQVSPALQPLVDAPFFFELAVALAYARGLSPEEIDRPRNLAKSVTTTGAEPREEVEARREFDNIDLPTFVQGAQLEAGGPSLRDALWLQGALAAINEPLPPELALDGARHLVAVTDVEATENGARMAAAAWQELMDIDLAVYRRYLPELPQVQPGTALLRFVRAGAVPAERAERTIALPSDLNPLQLELLTAVYLTGLAIRLARQRGQETGLWQAGLARLPRIIARLLADDDLARETAGALAPLVAAGYDKAQIIGGGQDYAAADSLARALRMRGFMAEALYTDSAWHGPLATVGGPGAEHDTLVIVLATDPLFQAVAMVDTQVYRVRGAHVILVVPAGNLERPAVRGVGAEAVLTVPPVPRPFTALVNAALGQVLADQMSQLWAIREDPWAGPVGGGR
jgi:glucosamine 6-phosphate synthetase-like amidotransferase/phosphosugar isomerase protein